MLLGEALEFFNGKSIKPGGEGEYPVYGSNGIIGGSDSFKYQNAIILGRVGAYCGSVAYCPTKFWASDNTIVSTPKNTAESIRYYYYLLTHLNLNRWAGGAAQPLLTQSVLKTIEAPIAKLKIQQKIASILSAYDDLIENNLKRIKILEEMAQMIYKEWFINFRFPGHEKVKMVKSEMGMIPEGWEVKKLGDIAKEVRRGVDPSEIDPNTPYFGLEHLPRKSITLSEWGTAEQITSTKLSFKKGEILFGKIRPYFHKVGVAPLNGICSSDTIVIAPIKTNCFGLTVSCVSSEDFVNHATQTSQGTKMPRADWKVLVKYPVILPPAELLDEFNTIAGNIIVNRHAKMTHFGA
jgi:type I restriction enzyme, S subunit